MSAAPRPDARPPPDKLQAPSGSPALSSCRRFLARPGRSSSPLRGCGRSTWTRSSPGSRAQRADQPQEEKPDRPLAPAPVFIERLGVDREVAQRLRAADQDLVLGDLAGPDPAHVL